MIYKTDNNIVKIKKILFKIAKEQATRDFSGSLWLVKILQEIEEIEDKIIIE